MNTTDTNSTAPETSLNTNFFIGVNGASMSIQTAVTMGLISRGQKHGTVFTGNREMAASAAVDAGIIGEDAAAYIASLGSTNIAAPHTREDAPILQPDLNPAESAIEALGLYFRAPTADRLTIATNALNQHYSAFE